MSGGSTGSTAAVRNCLAQSALGYGFFYSGSGGGTIENSILLLPSGLPFVTAAPGFAVSYCATTGVIPVGPGNITVASADFVWFADWDPFRSDYHLAQSSALRDAGDPITPPDLDGSRADIGLFGGQTPFVYFGLPDFPVVIGLEVPVSVPQNGILHIGSRGRVGQGGGE
jgi:hypothetical protein